MTAAPRMLPGQVSCVFLLSTGPKGPRTGSGYLSSTMEVGQARAWVTLHQYNMISHGDIQQPQNVLSKQRGEQGFHPCPPKTQAGKAVLENWTHVFSPPPLVSTWGRNTILSSQARYGYRWGFCSVLPTKASRTP